jgi:hypothetical protein
MGFMMVMTNPPMKLNMEAKTIAALGLIERVDIQVAMALAASVQPFTKMTPTVRSTVIIKVLFESTWPKKSDKATDIAHHLSQIIISSITFPQYDTISCTTFLPNVHAIFLSVEDGSKSQHSPVVPQAHGVMGNDIISRFQKGVVNFRAEEHSILRMPTRKANYLFGPQYLAQSGKTIFNRKI